MIPNDYQKRLEEVVSINNPYGLTEKNIREMLLETKPVIFGGHLEFLGFHSEGYLRMQAINQYSRYSTKIGDEIASWADKNFPKFNVALSPAGQGMHIAHDLAKTKGVRAAYANIEPETGRPTNEFWDGSRINPGDKVVIVNDINVTGESLRRLIELAESRGAEVLGACVFADMSGGQADIKQEYPFHSVINLNLPFWPENVCAQNCDGKPLVTMQQIACSPVIPGDVAYESFIQAK
ncbi:MAG: phosphoribosyltransferase family protein [Parcubacteria group bacterium]